MKRLSLLIVVSLGILPVAGETASTVENPIVIVLSWDGMRHDYLDRGSFPALERMAEQGVTARSLIPVFPSSTFPAHVSLATGTYPDRHGIVDNRFLDRKRGLYSYDSDANWIEAEPLWIAAERQGIKTATYFWVGSESDWRGLGTSYRIAPFDGTRPSRVKVDQILTWLELPEAERPRLIMSYWAGADGVGHDTGPDSEALTAQIKREDVQLGRLLKGVDALDLWSRLTLILVSDHGMTAWTKLLDVEAALDAADIDAVVVGLTTVHVHLKTPAADTKVRAVLAKLLGDVPGAVIYKGDTLPSGFRLQRHNRIGDWVIMLPPPYGASSSARVAAAMSTAASAGRSLGMHGYDPKIDDMGALFLAIGRGVPEMPLGHVRQVDLAATVAKLLGIEAPADSEGEPMW